jgi:hypothetical protein
MNVIIAKPGMTGICKCWGFYGGGEFHVQVYLTVYPDLSVLTRNKTFVPYFQNKLSSW